MIVSLTSTTSTAAVLVFSAVSAGTLSIELQYSSRPDFNWDIAPLIPVVSLGGFTLSGLNQRGRYYVRAREISSSGQVSAWSPVLGLTTGAGGARDLTPSNIMIEPALIITPEPVLSWATDNEVAGYPVRALGRDDPNSNWWADPSAGKFAYEAQMSGAPIDIVALLATNASEDTTITIKAGPSAANVRSVSPAYVLAARPFRASANLPQRRGYHAFVRLPEAQSYPYWRVEISGTIPGSRFAATYAVFGLAHSTKNFSSDSKTETLTDYGAIERDRSGNPARVDGARGRSVEFTISNMKEAQYETAFEQLRWKVGTTDPVLVLPNSHPGAFLHDRLLYGTLTAAAATNPYSPLFTQDFKVNSLI